MDKDFPCKTCGHAAIRHRKVRGEYKPGKVYCRECFDERKGERDNWHEFVPDNLRYLEQLNEKYL